MCDVLCRAIIILSSSFKTDSFRSFGRQYPSTAHLFARLAPPFQEIILINRPIDRPDSVFPKTDQSSSFPFPGQGRINAGFVRFFARRLFMILKKKKSVTGASSHKSVWDYLTVAALTNSLSLSRHSTESQFSQFSSCFLVVVRIEKRADSFLSFFRTE